MADIIIALLQDLGIYGVTPATFPELITWIATVTISAALLAGIFKTLFIICMEFRKAGRG